MPTWWCYFDEPGAETEAIIAKQRSGPTGVVRLTFLREFVSFVNYAA